jgi:hypothetical protein
MPAQRQTFDIVGSSCMESDCLYRGYQGELKPGDYVVFDNVGAYTNVLRPPFINPAPPILSIIDAGIVEGQNSTIISCTDGQVEIIRQGIGEAPMLA